MRVGRFVGFSLGNCPPKEAMSHDNNAILGLVPAIPFNHGSYEKPAVAPVF